MKDLRFANPEFFWLFVIIPLLIVWYVLKHKKHYTTITVSTSEGFNSIKPTLLSKLIHLPAILRMLALVFVIVILARPYTSSSSKSVKTEGIDIVMALDISSSMLSEDFKPNRLESAKKTAKEFIDNRENDRIGLVVFSSKSFTQCPVTIDHDILKNLFAGIKSGMIEDGTAIGMGLATAVDRLKDSKAASKVIILLTDGVNNTGIVSPATAAEIAKTFKIRVYTIGVGRIGKAPYPMQTPYGIQYVNIDVDIDEAILKQIASTTNGKYFRATNDKALGEIYSEIDKLEKTKIDESVFSRYTEKYFWFAVIAAVLFLSEIVFRMFVLKKLP